MTVEEPAAEHRVLRGVQCDSRGQAYTRDLARRQGATVAETHQQCLDTVLLLRGSKQLSEGSENQTLGKMANLG